MINPNHITRTYKTNILIQFIKNMVQMKRKYIVVYLWHASARYVPSSDRGMARSTAQGASHLGTWDKSSSEIPHPTISLDLMVEQETTINKLFLFPITHIYFHTRSTTASTVNWRVLLHPFTMSMWDLHGHVSSQISTGDF
jgi:hypothetical protein